MAICNRLERVLHQGKNICEQTIFAVTGERKEEKTFDVLFVDSRGAGASLLAEHYCRRAYPEAGTFASAGWAAQGTPDEAFVDFGTSKGLDLGKATPRSFDDLRSQLADYDLIIDLVGGVREHMSKIPFHTTVLSWPIDDRADPEAVHEQLSPRISHLMELLRGEDED
jgi:protein-tyrosine-phosphatase